MFSTGHTITQNEVISRHNPILEYEIIRKAARSQKNKIKCDLPLGCSRLQSPNSPANNGCCWPWLGRGVKRGSY